MVSQISSSVARIAAARAITGSSILRTSVRWSLFACPSLTTVLSDSDNARSAASKSATKAPPPDPLLIAIMPSCSSERRASRRATRLVSNCSAISRSGGSFCPGLSWPLTIAWRSWLATDSETLSRLRAAILKESVTLFPFIIAEAWSFIAASTLCAMAQSDAPPVVKITPLGSHAGEFCTADRAMVFEDPTGVRILYDPGRTVDGGTDARLGDIHVVILSHGHTDHVGDVKINPASPGTCAGSRDGYRPAQLEHCGDHCCQERSFFRRG